MDQSQQSFHLELKAGQASPGQGVVLAIGNFDGVHLGHRELIQAAGDLAQTLEAVPAVLTFSPHPAKVLNPEQNFKYLTPETARLEQLTRAGARQVWFLKFDAYLAQLAPEDFVRRVLMAKFKLKAVVVGFNFSFGYRGKGTPELLERLGKNLDFATVVIPPVQIEGRTVSSSEIRRCLERGEVTAAAKMLGRPYQVGGQVVHGEGRGRQLGVPTANVEVPPEILLPAKGVYACWAMCDNRRYPAVVNLGTKPTFGNGAVSLEANLLNFQGNLYQQNLTIQFIDYLRPEQQFAGAAQLIDQIRQDTELARRRLNLT